MKSYSSKCSCYSSYYHCDCFHKKDSDKTPEYEASSYYIHYTNTSGDSDAVNVSLLFCVRRGRFGEGSASSLGPGKEMESGFMRMDKYVDDFLLDWTSSHNLMYLFISLKQGCLQR